MKKITFISTLVFVLAVQSCAKKDDKPVATTTQSSSKQNDSIQSDISQKNLSKNNNLLFDIEGLYQSKDNASCNMNLKLYYSEGKLKYDLKTDRQTLTDFATLTLNEKKDGYYITLKNIKWSENTGAVDSKGNAIDKNLDLPKDIQGSLDKYGITIQNYGNAMNSYEKFAECGLKYINLIKDVK
ncbi:hypothetical protein [Chryseobacterium balustinum]|uniref:Lipoprotein n=1 Tax=Chryseobacterium balustinum TaxID=246 RepID=A0AAX2IR12_9FLAO|nr:hypothetical protein [Chryseobacterium balustinum]AZB28421.1 hypothetical protein EB354_03605 [Chryseobacterium balustinum]SKC04167.1 hypothetical protein SAMN05421800_1238 [Chryseobacterium balustinum]SQA92611.1 Uncharacterised protein [Chryseobacterium balustinum]